MALGILVGSIVLLHGRVFTLIIKILVVSSFCLLHAKNR
jgi:hypothetical protein